MGKRASFHGSNDASLWMVKTKRMLSWGAQYGKMLRLYSTSWICQAFSDIDESIWWVETSRILWSEMSVCGIRVQERSWKPYSMSMPDKILIGKMNKNCRIWPNTFKASAKRGHSHGIPYSSDCWLTISGFGSGAWYFAEAKNGNGNWNPKKPAVGLQKPTIFTTYTVMSYPLIVKDVNGQCPIHRWFSH